MKPAPSPDPEALRLPGPDLAALLSHPSPRPPRHRPGGKFLRGPIPWDWLAAAASLPGQALAVALLLWREAGCRKRRAVPFCLARGAELGVTAQAARRGLRALERAGLVEVARRPGRAQEVILQEAPAPPAPSAAPPSTPSGPVGPAANGSARAAARRDRP